MSRVILNTQTGEITDLEGYTLQSPIQKEMIRKHYEKERAKLRMDGRWFIMCYHDPIRKIIRDLSLIEAGAVIKLLPFLRFKSEGKLLKNGKPLKQSDIQHILKRGKKATQAILDRLETLGVIEKERDGRNNVYYISLTFHSMGDVISDAKFTKLYQVKAKQIADELDLNEIGLLYKILPFFHFQTYYLCDNPDEEEPEIIRHLNREQLAALIGHDPQTVYENINKLRSKGVIMTTGSRNTTHYLVHPDVMFRKEIEDEYTRVVRRMFEEHRRKSVN